MIDLAQISQDPSCKVYSTVSQNFFAFGLLTLVFGISAIIHQQLVAILRENKRFVHSLIGTQTFSLGLSCVKMPNYVIN